jgi:YidC/Oxa1 family membrane protein insertase
MFSGLMGAIYTGISWILLRWHDMWHVILPNGRLLGTNWDWILAIVFLVITVRVVLFPVFVKQIRSQRAMQAIAPKVKALQEQYKGDRETLQMKMMELYRTEKVNPLMGCLPMFLQIPVFLGLFHVLRHLNPLHHGAKTLYGFSIGDFDSASHAKLLGAPISMEFKSSASDIQLLGSAPIVVKIVAAVLVLIMMFTTYMTSRQMILKTGWSEDPQQKMMQRLMLYGIPFSLLLSGWAFPIGVIIYWVTQNGFSFGQQYYVLHKYPPPLAAGATAPVAKVKAGPSPVRALLQRLRLAAPSAAAAGTGSTTTPETKALGPRPGAKPVYKKPSTAGQPARDGDRAGGAEPAVDGKQPVGDEKQPADDNKRPPGDSKPTPGDGKRPPGDRNVKTTPARADLNGATPSVNGGKPRSGAAAAPANGGAGVNDVAANDVAPASTGGSASSGANAASGGPAAGPAPRQTSGGQQPRKKSGGGARQGGSAKKSGARQNGGSKRRSR